MPLTSNINTNNFSFEFSFCNRILVLQYFVLSVQRKVMLSITLFILSVISSSKFPILIKMFKFHKFIVVGNLEVNLRGDNTLYSTCICIIVLVLVKILKFTVFKVIFFLVQIQVYMYISLYFIFSLLF